MIGEAAAAFVDGDLPKTTDICQQVISIEPAAYAAWNTLSLVHEELGDPDTALKLKIMAAHLQGDADLWRELGRASRYVQELFAHYRHYQPLIEQRGKTISTSTLLLS
jgi:general transcription factor 3C polypeptide 3 (transcription factor C subunit 4)